MASIAPVHARPAGILLVLLVAGSLHGPAPASAQDRARAPDAERAAQSDDRFRPMDVFGLEWTSDPRISQDGERVAYVRNFMDADTDRTRSNLWIVGFDGSGHRPLTTGTASDGSPRWSPSGDRLLYSSGREGGSELWVRWMDTGQTLKVTDLERSPGSATWSPDGSRIAFTMFVPGTRSPLYTRPSPPEGAEWAEPARVIESLNYRADGRGYLEPGHRHVFVVPAEGGTPRQVTDGPFDHGSPTWTPDGRHLLVVANRVEEAERTDPNESEIHEVDVETGETRPLTDRDGPDRSPTVSPDGRRIAYTGYDDRMQGYQISRLYVMERDGSGSRLLTGELDRSVASPSWAADGSGIYFQYADEGEGRIGFVDLDGRVREVAGDVGGTTLGRPYASGSFTSGPGGRYAFTHTTPDRPADVAVGRDGRGDPRVLTAVNEDLLAHRELGQVEEIRWESSFDGLSIHGWIVKPPDFDPSRRYPMILEIHGGPFADYGPRFAAEIQLYAAAGYVVLYTNPRGSSSYGEEFGNEIHHAYPGQDYDDLMSGVDAVLERGYVDPDRLYVTGGSGGGVLSAWIVGTTDRFRAAVVAKPVINWTSFVLTADGPAFYHRYWFPVPPWEDPMHYWERSPLSRVGNVTTPTMLLTGEEDHRTPMSETEQFYAALQIQGVPSAMVRIPGASHGIVARPSNLVSKVGYVLSWFERYGGEPTP